jgi:membrane protein
MGSDPERDELSPQAPTENSQARSEPDAASQKGPAAWLGALDRFQRRHTSLAFPLAVARKFGDDRAGNLAAVLVYNAFLAIFPLLLLLVTILGVVLKSNPDLQDRLIDAALTDFPTIGEDLRRSIKSLSGSGLGFVVGIAGTLYGSLGVATALQHALNSIWLVPLRDRPGFPWNLLRSLAIIVFGGVGFLLATTMAGFLGAAGFMGAHLAALGLSVLLNIGVFWCVFRLATASVVTWADLFLGALISAIASAVLQQVGGYIIAQNLSRTTALYGFFALVLGLLAWMMVQATVTLYGAEVTVVYRRRLWPRGLTSPPFTEADQRLHTAYPDIERRDPGR